MIKLEKEMFKQGDAERSLGLPVSPLMDRFTGKGVTKAQTGFFNFVGLPLFKLVVQAFPGCVPLLESVKANLAHWTQEGC